MTARQPGPNELRDLLANERTLLSWIRTSIALVGLGFVVAKFGILIREIAGRHNHVFTARAGTVVGVLLVATGVVTAGLAVTNFERVRRGIERQEVRFSPTLAILATVIVAAVSIVLAIYLVVTA